MKRTLTNIPRIIRTHAMAAQAIAVAATTEPVPAPQMMPAAMNAAAGIPAAAILVLVANAARICIAPAR